MMTQYQAVKPPQTSTVQATIKQSTMCGIPYTAEAIICIGQIQNLKVQSLMRYRYTQVIKILTYVCVCVCVRVTEVGCSWGGTRLVTRNLRASIYCEECSRTLDMGWKAAVEVDAIGEQQLEWTQSGSSS